MNVEDNGGNTALEKATIRGKSDVVTQTIYTVITGAGPSAPASHLAPMASSKHKQGGTSQVQIFDNEIVKTVNEPSLASYNLLAREVCVLALLQQFQWCPRLLAVTTTTITMSFVGETVSARSLPRDYSQQYKQILADMASVGVRHNDIWCPLSGPLYRAGICSNGKSEVMVNLLNSRLSLVDFGWATVYDCVPCGLSGEKFPGSELTPLGWKPLDDASVLSLLDELAANDTKTITSTLGIGFV